MTIYEQSEIVDNPSDASSDSLPTLIPIVLGVAIIRWVLRINVLVARQTQICDLLGQIVNRLDGKTSIFDRWQANGPGPERKDDATP